MLELTGDLFVLAGRRRRPVPRTAIRVLLGIEHGRQRQVDGLPLRERRIAIERRADKRVAELDAAFEGAHQARQLRGIERIRLDAQRRNRPQDGRKAARVVGRDEQEQLLRLRRQAVCAVEIDTLDLRARRKRVGQRRASGQLLGTQEAGKLDQRERVPACTLDQPVSYIGRERREQALGEQRRGRLSVEGSKGQLPEAVPFEAPHLTVASREQHHDALRVEPPSRERERRG
jgi:hypothetical protein